MIRISLNVSCLKFYILCVFFYEYLFYIKYCIMEHFLKLNSKYLRYNLKKKKYYKKFDVKILHEIFIIKQRGNYIIFYNINIMIIILLIIIF